MSLTEEPPATIAQPVRGRAVVLYDGKCPLCLRSVRVLKRLDWLKKLHCQDCRDVANWPACREQLNLERLLEEMHLVTPDRTRALAGFAAFRWMAWRLPLTWCVAPLLHLPGAGRLGNRAYLWVARHRYNLIPCRDGICTLPRRDVK
jgi:predicted DCC family thiol-disulfide oxidoreductase YuxK